MGMREMVLDCKMENFDDFDYTEEAPPPATRADKQIRIHSLKKNAPVLRVREPSNLKDKKAVLNTLNTEMPFRSTELGFKRLLRPNLKSQNTLANPTPLPTATPSISAQGLLELVELPRTTKAQDLLINVKDPWASNLQRAANLCGVVKRWNEFHHRVSGLLKEVEKDLPSLVKKSIRVDRQISEYLRLFEAEPYSSVRTQLQGAEKQLLIDEQLNKLGRVFNSGHAHIQALAAPLEKFISLTHEACAKLTQKRKEGEGTWVLEYLSVVEETIEQFNEIAATSPQLMRLLAKCLYEIIDALLEEAINFEVEVEELGIALWTADVKHLCRRNDFFEVFYECYGNCLTGMLKLGEGTEEENLGISLLATKFRNLKTIAHHLWSMSRYFAKLTKQLATREKKPNSKSAVIRNFLQSYENYSCGSPLLDWKNPQRAEKEVGELKQRVGGLKGSVQGE